MKNSLNFLHCEELKEIALKLGLSEKGKKGELIARIMHFLQTGEKLTLPRFPTVSCAKRGVSYPLDPKTLMLKGAYKNDLKTRLFFKRLIGEHFHFTAFGIDWLERRWMEGNPPTYQEFAEMWQERKKMALPPKEEWAYINFLQQGGTKEMWEKERLKHKQSVLKMLSHSLAPSKSGIPQA